MMDDHPVSLPPAPLFRRLAALVYDSFIIFSFWLLATAIALAIVPEHSLTPYPVCFPAYLLVSTGLFISWLWHKDGQTLGMLAWKIKMLTDDNQRLSWPHALRRFCFAWVNLASLGLGLLWCMCDRKRQSAADRLARTKMVCIR